MPLNMEKNLMRFPDFGLGETSSTERHTEFRPLLEGAGEIEMMRDILIDAPILLNSNGAASEAKTEKISLVEHHDVLNDLKKHHENELKNLEERHQNYVLAQLEQFKLKLFEDISKQLENKVVEALAPLVENCISQKSLDEIVGEIHSIARKEALKSVRVSGPALLIFAVEEKFSNSEVTVEVEETDELELVVCLNDQSITTRLEAWRHKIANTVL